MSRLLSTFIACLLSALVLAGCGGEADTPSEIDRGDRGDRVRRTLRGLGVA